MIRIIAYLQDGSGGKFELETDQNEDIYLTKQLLDITQISKRKTDFSQTFIVPETDRNAIFFGYFFDTGMVGVDFNPYKVTHCDILSNGVQVFSGNLKLEKYEDKKSQYTVVVFGQLNTLSTSMADNRMSEIDLSALSHEHTKQNIVDSWDLLLAGGEVLYPIADYGRGYGNYTDLPTNPITRGIWDIGHPDTPILLNDLRPAVRLKTIVQALFDSIGLTLDCPILDTALFDTIFVQLHTPNLLGSKVIALNDAASYHTPADWEIPQTETRVPLTCDPISPYYDNAAYEFTALVDGNYFFDFSINTNGGNQNNDNTLRIYHNAALLTTIVQAQTDSIIAGSFSVNMVEGGTVYMTIETDNDRTANSLHSIDANSFRLAVINQAAGTNIYPQLLMDDIKQIDFFTSFLQTFNLVAISDEAANNLFHIYTWEQYFTAGVRRNWTGKINKRSTGVIKPMNDVLNKEVEFSFGDSDAINNVNYKGGTGYNYGTYHRHTGIAYAEGVKALELVFQPYVTSDVGSDIGLFPAERICSMEKYYTDLDSLSATNMKLQLFIYSGLMDVSWTLLAKPYYAYDITDIPNGVLMSELPICQPFTVDKGGQAWICDADEFSLTFGNSTPLGTYPVAWVEDPERNIYTEYFQSMMNELYSAINKRLTLSFLLSPNDVTEFRWNDLIELYYRGTPDIWRVQKISNYRIGQYEACDVELTKALAIGVDEEVYPPTGLTVKNYEIQTYLQWVAAGGVSGYDIYRSYDYGSGYIKVNNTLITANEYIDISVRGNRNYYYKIQSVGQFGGVSEFTEPVFVNRFDSLVGFGTQSRFAYAGGVDPKIMAVDRLGTSSTDGEEYPAQTDGIDYRGTLYYCMAQSFPRIILFETSGTINATTGQTINLGGQFMYVAGQTTPNPGIEYYGGTIAWGNCLGDVLLRHLTLGKGVTQNDLDAVTMRELNSVVDRCTVRWGRDEVLSWSSAEVDSDSARGTQSRNLIYESLMNDEFVEKNTFGHPYMGLGYLQEKSYYMNFTAYGTERFPLCNQDFDQGANKLTIINTLAYGGWNRVGPDIGDYTTSQLQAVIMGIEGRRMNNEYYNALQDYAVLLRADYPVGMELFVDDLSCQHKDEGEDDSGCVYDPDGNWTNLLSPPFDVEDYEVYSQADKQDLILNRSGSKWRDEHDRRIISDYTENKERRYGLDLVNNSAHGSMVSGMLNSIEAIPARAVNWNHPEGDVSAGIDFSTINYQFTLTTTSGGTTLGPHGITLDENCIVFAAVIQHINDKLAAAGYGTLVEAYNPANDGVFVALRTLDVGEDEVLTLANNTDDRLGWANNTYYGEDAGGHMDREVNTHVLDIPANPHGAWGNITNLEKWIIDTFPVDAVDVNLTPDLLNIIVNGGGLDTTDWINATNGLAESWSVFGSNGGVPTIVTGNGFVGNAQRLSFLDDSVDAYTFLHQTLVCEIGKTYNFSVKYRCSNGFRVLMDGATGLFNRYSAQTGDAVEGVGTFTATQTSHQLRIYMHPSGSPAIGSWIEADELNLIESTRKL